MHTLRRGIYHLLLRLHPGSFRAEFERDMALDFEDAANTFGFTRLFLDAAVSLVRQWSADIALAANPAPAQRPSLLAGSYVTVRYAGFTPLQLGLGFIASSMQLLLCLWALNAAPKRPANLSNASAFLRTTPAASNAAPGTPSPAEGSGFPFEPSTSSAAFAGIRSPQTDQLKPELLLFHPHGPYPSYEVATINAIDPETASTLVRLPPGGSLGPLSIRRYIMNAYGAIYPAQVIGGCSSASSPATLAIVPSLTAPASAAPST